MGSHRSVSSPPVTSIRFRTADGLSLVGEIREADDPRGTAVLCHPHPRHGGSKDHPVLWAIRNDLAARRGLTVLAFNFRGIMGSEGSYGGGHAEVADVAAAVDRVRQEIPGPTLLAGWSFGAWVALRHAATDRRIGALVLVGIPLAGALSARRPLPSLAELESVSIPVLLVAGDGDEFCPLHDLHDLAGWLPAARTLVVEGTDHFFSRREREVAEGIGGWVNGALAAQ
jgi:alpha/beta superfamily hydrolase